MKKFVYFLFGLCALVIGLLFLLDYAYTAVYQNSAPRNKFQYILQLAPQKIDYVFLGSSRVANTIVTKEVEKITGGDALNLGVEGAHLEDNLLQLKLLLHQKVKIDKLFLQVDYQFEDKGRSPIALSEAMPFIKNPVVKEHLESIENQDFTFHYTVPFYRYMMAGPKIGFREFFFNLINKKAKIDISDGFTPKQGQVAFEEYSLPKSIRKSNVAIEQIKAICAKEQIDLILFCAPFCSETQNKNYIEALKVRLPELKDYSFGFEDVLFYDCAHLNETGAVIFTKKLIKNEIGSERNRKSFSQNPN